MILKEMTYFKRFLIVLICGIMQIFYAAYLLLNLFGYKIDWHISNHDLFMFIPGILVFVGSGILTASYYLGDKKINNILYDEYTALRYYKIASIGYVLNGIGIFVLFSIQDWANWSFQNANNMIYQIAAFAWLIFGVLLIIFAIGDYKEYKNG